MDIEFHYYMTYLIAVKAGFGTEEAQIIAYSSQYTDDNDIECEIGKDTAEYYKNYISQTMNILKPKPKLFRIYPLFHFIPGDPMHNGALRKDGRLHFLNTTPNNENASRIIDTALETDNLYRIGIASHSYVDTWAHQNFIGYYDPFNAMGNVFEKPLPNIGHADAEHNPDWPGLVWQDRRLLGKRVRVDNKERFMDAARNLFTMYRRHVDKKYSEESLQKDAVDLVGDLSEAIGGRDQENRNEKSRIEKYQKLSERAAYGDKRLKTYDAYEWFEDAVNEDVRGLRDHSDFFLSRWDPIRDIYSWKDPGSYKTSNWYKFQEAVKSCQNDAWAITDENTFKNMDLRDLESEQRIE